MFPPQNSSPDAAALPRARAGVSGRWRSSLRLRITLTALAMLAAVSWSSAFLASHFLKTDIEKSLIAQQQSAASFVADDVQRELLKQQQLIAAGATRLVTSVYRSAPRAQRFLEERPALLGNFNRGLFVVDRDGKVIASLPEDLQRVGRNLGQRADVREALQDGKPHLSDALADGRDGARVLSVVYPIVDADGGVHGAFVGENDLEHPNFLDTLRGQHYGSTGGYLLIAPARGLVITATDPSRVMQPVPPPGRNVLHDRIMRGEEVAGVSVNSRGVEELVAARRVPALGWMLVAVLPTDEAFAPVREIRVALFVLAAALTLLAAALCWLLLRRELLPLADIALHLRAMSRAEIPRSALPQRSDDEIGEVAASVNALIVSVEAAEGALRGSDKLNRSILDSLSECVCVLDSDGVIVRVNDAWQRLGRESAWLGTASQHFADSVGRDYFSLCPNGLLCASDESSERAALTAIANVLAGRCLSERLEYLGVLCLPTGALVEPRWLEMRVSRLDDYEGAVIAHEDITPIKHVDELQTAAAAFHTQEGIIITDVERRIMRVNGAFTRMTGYAAEEAIGQTPALLRSGKHDAEFYRAMNESLRDSGFWQGEIWDRYKNGRIVPQWMTITAVLSAAGEVSHFVAAFFDISERKEAEAQVHALAFFDPLTGLPNRRLLHDRLAQALAASARSGRRGALMFLDLDHFKRLNDTQGHEVGDQLLVEVARRLEATVREGDTVARLGGDEFVVMLEGLADEPRQAAAQAEEIAGKLLATLARPFVLSNLPERYYCTCSIGVVLFLGHDASVDDLLRHADVAMYQAKAASRNAVRFFDPQMQQALEMRTQLESELGHGIATGELRLHYQLQVDAGGQSLGAEALVRWQHPQRGLLAPAAFIPLAEESGLIIPLGEWVLRETCRQLAIWAAMPEMRSLTLAVNVSRRQFRHADFVDTLRRTLHESGADPTKLRLELTEDILLEADEMVFARVREIRGLGVAFSLDDFGVGYSSLPCLHRMPLEQLKIDRSFVCRLGSDADALALVRMLVALGAGLGVPVIAEGVESEVQRRLLREAGCGAFQGYFFGVPTPADEFSPRPAHG
ncbi:bifunctional diguanylate cyclase/phosphodiesterase [Rhodocyclus gracilis]|uniref:EAL domain-containing protein n=1 Tax=Rhodocyclus tenuis TaxID=1066 RepID=A0A6L5JS27_RHOTE|nr:EAL domain-containing protein [Rhodocyclus gracilis]MQY50247.1 EAL domain-containing protein [Rhodocyclus gracilis]